MLVFPRSINVLIIEDSHRDAQLILGELRDGGFDPVFERVQTAETMEEALMRQKWDVILSDYSMPKFTGLDALRILKVTELDIPFILISGAIGEEIAVQLMKMGAMDYILKSNLARLTPAIERELKDAESRKQKRQAEEELYKLNKELEQRVFERTEQLTEVNISLNKEIEERKLVEEALWIAKQVAEEANREKSKVLSFVAHDFKNPLAAVLRFVGMLENDKNTPLSEKHRETIGYISEGVQQLRNMVMNILDKARLEEGRMVPFPEQVELQPFIDQLKPIFHDMATQRNVEVCIEIQPELINIEVDPIHLRQILINLVSNAVKYNQLNGKAFLRFSQSEDGQWAVIEVQDIGNGIPTEKIPQLFIEYYRTDLSQANKVEGTGLGLAFVKKLVELHSGSITVESEVRVGSTFRVMLPLTVGVVLKTA